MPVFDSPKPISVTIDIGVGNVHITAEDRSDTVAEVRPTDETDSSDVKAAQQASVEFTNGVLVIKTPKPRPMDLSRKTRSVEVSIALPVGSHVRGEASVGDLRVSGRLGECSYKTATGNIHLDHTGPLRLKTAGHIAVGRIGGDAEVRSTTGRIRIAEVDGAIEIKSTNGHTEVGKVSGEIKVRASNGDITVDHAQGVHTEAETANGSIRIGEVTRGVVELKTASGDLEVGIGANRPAKLDLSTGFGRVHNALEVVAESSEEAVDVRARTSYGDITIHRT